MLAHAQKEFRAARREEKAKQVTSAVAIEREICQSREIFSLLLSPPGGTFEDG